LDQLGKYADEAKLGALRADGAVSSQEQSETVKTFGEWDTEVKSFIAEKIGGNEAHWYQFGKDGGPTSPFEGTTLARLYDTRLSRLRDLLTRFELPSAIGTTASASSPPSPTRDEQAKARLAQGIRAGDKLQSLSTNQEFPNLSNRWFIDWSQELADVLQPQDLALFTLAWREQPDMEPRTQAFQSYVRRLNALRQLLDGLQGGHIHIKEDWQP
jgi:hypothetical protein